MKKLTAFVLTGLLLFSTGADVFAHCGGGGGRGRGHNSNYQRQTTNAWHDGTEYYDGHYSNYCSDYDHVLHNATSDYQEHYAYDCNSYGHDGYQHGYCRDSYHH